MNAKISFQRVGCLVLLWGAVLTVSCVTAKTADVTTKVTKDLVYAERTGVNLKADWYPAESGDLAKNKKTPACIVIHGGGWYKGDKKDMDAVASRLAQSGIAALNINYRLAPAHRFPAPVIDTKDAIRWLKGNAGALGVDEERLCLFGYSAGAHLALMGGFTKPSDGLDDSRPPAAKVFSFGTDGVLKDLPRSLDVHAIAAGGSPTDLTGGNYNKYYEAFFGEPPAKIPEIYRSASPVTYVRKGLPPTFLYHGKLDWVVEVEQSRQLVDKLRSKGVVVEYLEVTFGHVATFLFDEKEVGAAIKFLKEHLRA
jgi:acetyl esterase/lipase